MRATSRVVGMVAGERQHVVAQIHKGDPVLLKPEPDNPYDANAIAVYTAPLQVLLHADDLVSSVTRPPGEIHPDDRALILDRQAGYLPKELAARLDLHADGVVGWVSAVRFPPPVDVIRFDGSSEEVPGGPNPVGFDVTAWFTYADRDPEGGGWGT